MRHQKKRWFAALLSLCMLLSILPSTSIAFSESEETWSGNRRKQTIDGGTHTITLSNLTIDSPGVEKSAIDITGNADVTFILEGNNTLRGYRNHPAIWVESGSSVTFEGNGLLEASAGGASIGLGAAGIGGGYGASSNFGNITIMNTINFKKSHHYNPFSYIHSEKDILKLVNCLIVNTKGEGGKSGDDFWLKAEMLLYTALIGYIHYEAPEEEQNFSTLLEMINAMEVREDDEEFKNAVDLMFDELKERDPGHFAVRQYAKYKLAAGVVFRLLTLPNTARA